MSIRHSVFPFPQKIQAFVCFQLMSNKHCTTDRAQNLRVVNRRMIVERFSSRKAGKHKVTVLLMNPRITILRDDTERDFKVCRIIGTSRNMKRFNFPDKNNLSIALLLIYSSNAKHVFALTDND